MDSRLKKSIRRGVLIGAGLAAAIASAATFNLFSPATGILKGNSSTYVTTAAASSDVVGLFTGCSGVQYLGADGACHTASSGTPANPTATVGTTATNGTATTYMRSDAAPALNLAITPVWTGFHTFTQGIEVDQPASTSNALLISGHSGTPGVEMLYLSGSVTTGQSQGITIQAGTNSSDFPFLIYNATHTQRLLQVSGDGGVVLATATGGDKGLGTLNATGLFVNGVAVGGGGGTPGGSTGNLQYNNAGAFAGLVMTADQVPVGASPTATSLGSCSNSYDGLSYNTSTHAFGCNVLTITTTLTGDVTGSASVGGTGTTSVATTLASSGVSAGSYKAADITVDAKGRVTAAASDVGRILCTVNISLAGTGSPSVGGNRGCTSPGVSRSGVGVYVLTDATISSAFGAYCSLNSSTPFFFIVGTTSSVTVDIYSPGGTLGDPPSGAALVCMWGG